MIKEMLNYSGGKTSNEVNAVAKIEVEKGKNTRHYVKVKSYGLNAGGFYYIENPYIKETDNYGANGNPEYTWRKVPEESYNYYVSFLKSDPKSIVKLRQAERIFRESVVENG